jgi:uncharacterized protein YciI
LLNAEVLIGGGWRRHIGFIGQVGKIVTGCFAEVRYYFTDFWARDLSWIAKISCSHWGARHSMSKQHFYFKLIPPRPTFAADMTAEERALMMEHVRYTREAFDAGKILIYGPVMASTGGFGVAVLEMENVAEVQKFGDEDPSIKAGMNTFEFCPMRIGAARGLA